MAIPPRPSSRWSVWRSARAAESRSGTWPVIEHPLAEWPLQRGARAARRPGRIASALAARNGLGLLRSGPSSCSRGRNPYARARVRFPKVLAWRNRQTQSTRTRLGESPCGLISASADADAPIRSHALRVESHRQHRRALDSAPRFSISSPCRVRVRKPVSLRWTSRMAGAVRLVSYPRRGQRRGSA